MRSPSSRRSDRGSLCQSVFAGLAALLVLGCGAAEETPKPAVVYPQATPPVATPRPAPTVAADPVQPIPAETAPTITRPATPPDSATPAPAGASFAEALASGIAAKERVETENRLKTISGAIANNDLNGSPLAVKVGKPGSRLSWRVKLLPMLDGALLYRKFKLDEPWDSEHNKALIGEMPAVYRSSGNDSETLAKAGKTRFRGFSGNGAPFGRDEGFDPDDVKDKLHQTLLIVEAGSDKAIEWTRPDELEWDMANPVAALGTLPKEKFPALMASGRVRWFPTTVKRETLKGLITFAAGDEVGDF